jgi:hypothetical protein
MSEFSEYISKIRGVNFEDEDIMHVRDSRTDEYARSPQEPVVHQSCDQQTNSEQSGAFVQGGMEPPVREAVDVHQSAATVERVSQCLAKLAEEHNIEEKRLGDARDYFGAHHHKTQRWALLVAKRVVENMFRQAQSEAVDGERAAAD